MQSCTVITFDSHLKTALIVNYCNNGWNSSSNEVQLNNEMKSVTDSFKFVFLFNRYMGSGAVLQDDQATSQNHLSFPNLLNHLSHLVTGPDFIADVAKNEMRSRLVERYSTGTHACNDSLSSNLNIWEDIFELIPL